MGGDEQAGKECEGIYDTILYMFVCLHLLEWRLCWSWFGKDRVYSV